MEYNFCIILSSLIIIFNLYNLNFIRLKCKDIIILSVLASSMVEIINMLNEKIGIFREMLLVPCICLISIIYIYNLTKDFSLSIISSSIASLILFTTDIIMGYLVLCVFYITKNSIFELKKPSIIFNLILFLVNFICSKLIGFYFDKILKKNYKIKDKIKELIAVNIIIILTVVYVLCMIGKLFKEEVVFLGISIFLITILCITLIITFHIYQEYIRKDLHDIYVNKELNQLKKYICAVEDMYNEIRRIKHDHVNILCSINGYIEDNNIKSLKKYFNENILKLNDSLSINAGNLMKIKHIKVDGVKGLIFSKMLQAKNKSVDLFVDISEDIEKFYLESIDLCKVLGILLDNAIEEAELCSKPKIKFGIIKCTSSLVIVIINSCRSNIPYVYKMFEYGFSTKGENRGIGLSNIKDIIDKKYNNVTLNTYIDNGEFKQELIIDHK